MKKSAAGSWKWPFAFNVQLFLRDKNGVGLSKQFLMSSSTSAADGEPAPRDHPNPPNENGRITHENGQMAMNDQRTRHRRRRGGLGLPAEALCEGGRTARSATSDREDEQGGRDSFPGQERPRRPVQQGHPETRPQEPGGQRGLGNHRDLVVWEKYQMKTFRYHLARTTLIPRKDYLTTSQGLLCHLARAT
jgi:hypothetical protein